MRPRLFLAIAWLLLAFSGVNRLHAQVFVWTGIGDDEIFSTNENWVGMAAPGSAATAQFGAYGGNHPTVRFLDPTTIGTIEFLANRDHVYTFSDWSDFATVNLGNSIILQTATNPVFANVNFSETLTLNLTNNTTGNIVSVGTGATLQIDGVVSGAGHFTKMGTGTLVLTAANTFHYTGGGSFLNSSVIREGTVHLNGGTIDHGTTGDIWVGENSGDNGTLIISNGGSASGYFGVLGNFVGSTGNAVVTGTGSIWTNSNGFDVGHAGTGILTVANGGIVSVTGGTNTISLATSGGNGTLNIGSAELEAATDGGIINANSISSGSGTATLQFNTTATSGSPYYLTKDGTAGGTAVALTGYTKIVVTAGYTVLKDTGNTYSDTTTINGGTLADANAGAFSASSPITVGAAGSLQVNFTETVGGLAGSGTTTIASGATLTVDSNANHLFSGLITGSGTLNVTGGGALTLTGNNTYAGGTFVEDGDLILNAGTITHASNDLVVGHTNTSGSAIMDVTNGGTLTNRIGYIGYAAGTDGNMGVFGSGALWTNTDYLYVGVQGDGELDIHSGGVVSSPYASIGNNGGSFGAVYVGDAGSKLDIANTLYLGAEGEGYLYIYDDGLVESTNVSIGNNALGVGGMAELNGPGSTWTNTNDFLVGNAQDGYLYVIDQGAVTTNTATIGVLAGVDGSLAVYDGGSFTSTGHLVVGGSGIGELSFSSAGIVTTGGNAVVANSPGSTGDVYLGDAGSVWTVGGNLVVGNNGDGYLRITDSAVLNVGAGTGTITLGAGTGGTGQFHIGYNGEGFDAGGIINAASITTGTGTGTVLLGTNTSKAAPFYLTRNGTGTGTYVTIDGSTNVQQVFGYNVLGGNSTYSGTTAISGGTLVAATDNALGDSNVIINGGTLSLASGVSFDNLIGFGLAGGKLAGEGTFTSPLTLGANVTLSPGSSPGIMNFGSNLTLNNGGSLEIEIRAPAGTPGTDWDFVSIAGTFNLGDLTAGGYSLKVISLDLANNPGAVSGLTDPTSWIIASAGGGITGFEETDFVIDISQFFGGGNFTLSSTANDLVLSFTPVPEPSTYALMMAGLALAGWGYRRRKSRSHAE